MARSRVSRTFPTLPPSAISASAMALAEDRDADVVEGGCDRGVRLVNGDADGRDLSEAVEHGIGDSAGGGFYQAVALGAERLARGIDHLVVTDGVGELVGVGCLREIDVQHEVELEGLADLGLVLHHAMIGVQRQPTHKHLVCHKLFRRAAATRSAWMVSATSWVRMIEAPFI